MSTAPSPIASGKRRWFPSGGDMGDRIEALGAASGPLGPVEAWPVALRNAVALMLPAQAEIVLFWGPEYVALYNDAYAPTIGTKHPGALGRPARESWSELWGDLEPLLRRVRETGETFADKQRAFYLERFGYGETTYFDISYSAVPDDDGTVGGVLCIVADVSDRVRAANSLAAERERLAQMFDQAPGFMAVLRQPGHVVELINASYQQLVGHRDLIGRTIREGLPELEGQGFFELLDTVAATGKPYRDFGARVSLQRQPNGPVEPRYVDFIFQPVTDAQALVTAIFVEGNDVTERHRIEERLALSEEALRLATEAAEIGTWDVDVVNDVLHWSDRTRAMFGISPGVPCTLDTFYAGLHPDDLEATARSFAAALDPARRSGYDVEYRTVGAEDGLVRWVAAKGRGLFDASGRCIRALGVTIDITERKRVEAELRESEIRFRQLADSAPALMWVSDSDAGVVFANQAFETMLGVSPTAMLDGGWHSLIDPVSRTAFNRDVFDRHLPFSGDVAVRDAAGGRRWLHIEARPRFLAGLFHGYVGSAVDVTDAHNSGEMLERLVAERTAELTHQIEERERVEAALHQMQRLEAVGQLTSGVAHDFNNLLTVVLGNVDMLGRAAERTGLDERSRTRIDHIRSAAQRGAKLTAQLLAFSRRQRLEAKPLDLNVTVEGMQEMVRTALGNAITVETRLAPDIWPALVDPTQIELIILNLAINARDAMEVGGMLRIETANVTRRAPERPEEPPAGDHVMVAVRDTGTGMAPEVLAKAFEPFFTTKEVGRGSGLGLAQVFGFAKQSGGGVKIETAVGEGTRVCVYLPRAASAAEGESGPVASPFAAAFPGATIMIVDDDAPVRAVTAETLGTAGWSTIEAESGAEALALLREPGRHVDAVVADFAMPGMNGAELARHVAALLPDLPFLVLTGYADRGAIADVAEAMIISKPFRADDLIARVGQQIAAAKREAERSSSALPS